MKKIFLCESEGQLNRVYPDDLKTTLSDDGVIYKKADVVRGGFEDVEYIFSTWGMPVFEKAEIEKYLPSLKAVYYGAGSVQFFARPFLEAGVRVFSSWLANAVPVAEYTVAQIILANKGFYSSSRIMKGGYHRDARENFSQYPGNYGATVGIIGAGTIGKMVIERLKAFELSVVVFDPFLPDEKAAELGTTKLSLPELFSRSQVVSNHLANNEKTKGILGGALFEAMPRNATFINTGRGAQVVEEELISVLGKRPDITAILDVTEPEPPLPNSPFYTLQNCILTPHIAGSSGFEVHRMAQYASEAYEATVRGESSPCEVTLKMLETMA